MVRQERHLIDPGSAHWVDDHGVHDASELIIKLGEHRNGKKIPASCVEELITNSRELLLARGLTAGEVVELAAYVRHRGFPVPADWGV